MDILELEHLYLVKKLTLTIIRYNIILLGDFKL